MIFAPLFALALAVQDAAPQDAASKPADAPPASETQGVDPEIPANAPKDDFGLVAWCNGIVRGHLTLYRQLEPMLIEAAKKRGEKNAEETAKLDRALMQDEEGFLAVFDRSLAAAAKASPTSLAQRRAEAEAQGARAWGGLRVADNSTKLLVPGWGVPSRCLSTSKQLEQRSALLGQALKGSDAPTGPQ
jgi:hypothetical protein